MAVDAVAVVDDVVAVGDVVADGVKKVDVYDLPPHHCLHSQSPATSVNTKPKCAATILT